MLIKAKIENHNEYLFMEELPEKFVSNYRLSERQVNIKQSPVDMKNCQLSTNGLFLLHAEMNFSENVRIETEIEGDAIASQFIFSKEKKTANKNKPRYGRSRHNIRYLPTQKESYEVRAEMEYIYFLVVLSKGTSKKMKAALVKQQTSYTQFSRHLQQGRIEEVRLPEAVAFEQTSFKRFCFEIWEKEFHSKTISIHKQNYVLPLDDFLIQIRSLRAIL